MLHIVETGRTPDNPLRGAQSAFGEGLASRGFVREFDSLARAGENHRVLSDNVPAANRVYPDFLTLARADDACAAMLGNLLQWLRADGGEDLAERFGGAAGR